MQVATEIYELTEELPRKEDFCYTTQIRKAALSIPANIAEAFGREHSKDKINFYYFARGSIMETISHLEYGKRVNYLSEESVRSISNLLETLAADLNKLIKSLRSNKG